ncbi:MAG: serine/threonine-protein kinase, partial [Candidatus Palauibacterales bacterium]|nr:serine/threonine-protein kinase [Candidatus Palauibacterales bacterium]
MTLPSPSAEFLALQQAVVGRYSLERELGRGGMGIVFLARDVGLDRLVAIKLLPPVLAAIPTVRDRFLREARMVAGLSHPNIVPIHAVEERDDLVYFVMGFVDGEALGPRIRRAGPLAPRDVMRVIQEVAWALGHAHA